MSIKTKRPIDLVMWDLDGTLIHSEYLHVESVVHACELAGMRLGRTPIIPPGYCGKSVYRYLFNIPEAAQLPAHYLTWYSATIDYVVQHISKSSPATEAMLFCRDLWDLGFCQVVVSNSSRRIINAALRHHGLRDAFDALYSGDDVAQGKPHPDVYIHAAAAHGVERVRCLAFEDSVPGISAAREVGIPVVAVTIDSEIRAGADFAVNPNDRADWHRLARNINLTLPSLINNWR